MTDDCDAERLALSKVWSEAILLLCVFHVLQAMWNWLWAAKNKIEHNDRQILLVLFRNVLYAETEVELADQLEKLYTNKTVNKYPLFLNHLKTKTMPKMKAWSIERRITDNLPTSSNNTTNLVESTFKYVKDIMFNRNRAFDLTEMLSIVLEKGEWYVNKVVDAANNRIEQV